MCLRFYTKVRLGPTPGRSRFDGMRGSGPRPVGAEDQQAAHSRVAKDNSELYFYLMLVITTR